MELNRGSRPTLLVSGVAAVRSSNARETALTSRLAEGVRSVAAEDWDVVLSWAEDDGIDGTLGQLALADAVVMLGGPDVSPQFYGGLSPYPEEGGHFLIADEAQIALARESVNAGIPFLGICRGLQILNVALGGTLVQHIDSGDHTSPTLLDDFCFVRHQVTLSRHTLLGNVVARAVASERTEIHSAHHQAIKDVAAPLVVAAASDDGVIEAVEHESAPAFAVQWHPEDPDARPTILRALLAHLHSEVSASSSRSTTRIVA